MPLNIIWFGTFVLFLLSLSVGLTPGHSVGQSGCSLPHLLPLPESLWGTPNAAFPESFMQQNMVTGRQIVQL